MSSSHVNSSTLSCSRVLCSCVKISKWGGVCQRMCVWVHIHHTLIVLHTHTHTHTHRHTDTHTHTHTPHLWYPLYFPSLEQCHWSPWLLLWIPHKNAQSIYSVQQTTESYVIKTPLHQIDAVSGASLRELHAAVSQLDSTTTMPVVLTVMSTAFGAILLAVCTDATILKYLLTMFTTILLYV